jgi:hypothetical protein
MAEVFVAKLSGFPDGERPIVNHGPHDIGVVFHWQGEFSAYANVSCTLPARRAWPVSW